MIFFALPFLAAVFVFTLAAPSDNSFVVSSTDRSQTIIGKEGIFNDVEATHPLIYAMDINSNISNRFAKTLVLSKVKNAGNTAKEATFTVVLPEKAFISEFVMEIGGKSYKAYVKEKEEAKNIYNKAVASGQSAGHVEVSARDSNRFTVSVNIEAESKAEFLLTYEELLERRDNQYELVLNIHPGQIVKDLNVQVMINESRPLRFVKTPPLRSGNEISKNDDKLDPSSDIKIINSTSAIVKFSPGPERQKQFGIDLRAKENEGLAGQFVVQYDVERDSRGGEVLLQDGYFVHFFAPEDLEPLSKHVVFVLDTSGSMSGSKMEQLKDAMYSILDQLRPNDIFHIVEFNSNVFVWNIDSEESVKVDISNYQEPFEELTQKNNLPSALSVMNESIQKGKSVIGKIDSRGITNIIGGLETGLHLIKIQRNKEKEEYQPMIIFLTDGYPNVGVSSTDEITKIVTDLNAGEHQIPIFSLSFGRSADKSFLRKLSLKNLGLSRHIYEASDASLQLQDFYRQISSPLLTHVNFKYDSEVEEVTKRDFPIFFRGSEIVVSGRFSGPTLQTSIHGRGSNGTLVLSPSLETPVTSLERLWAYLTVKQDLQRREVAENKIELTKKILDLALKYSFVTEVTSLVVVKPNDTSAVETEDASDSHHRLLLPSSYSPRYSSSIPMAGVPGNPGIAGPQGYYPIMYPRSGAAMSIQNFDGDRHGYRYIMQRRPSYKSRVLPIRLPNLAVSSTPSPTIKSSLPWLSSVLDANNSLNISGGVYEIGGDSTVNLNPDCPKSPVNSTVKGHCTLLKDCPQVHHFLTDFQVYQQYFCPLENKYAGVCCPKINQVLP
ncbi:unnamed protein product [Phaedon cochleariae]|uniref:Inter-alpha-trypsin inhibitor heavy chain H4-like n=1 Tax=Phaedon cochleariae TaxID=80249 RepID=A0A9N9X4Y7_PHACE|nr:unnamed protein product [Phaedon cochleariae]